MGNYKLHVAMSESFDAQLIFVSNTLQNSKRIREITVNYNAPCGPKSLIIGAFHWLMFIPTHH